METRIIVAGSRDFDNRELLHFHLDRILATKENAEIVSGHAKGADSMAEEYAKEKGIALSVFPADWKQYGRAAGPIRNKQMLDYICEGNPVLVAFWDGESRGTKNMIDIAKKRNVECHVIVGGGEV